MRPGLRRPTPGSGRVEAKPRGMDLRVERIDLSAMPAGGERAFRHALERALSRLSTAAAAGSRRPVPTRPHETAGRHGTSHDRGPGSIAARVARQVEAGLSQERRR